MSHRVTALRDGRVVGTVDTSTMDETKLVSFMLGRAVETSPANTEMATASKGFLSIHALAGRGVASVSFDVARGEVVGIAGLVGSGASEVLRMLFGAEPISSGDVTLDGQPYRPASPRSAMAAGVAYVPSDRAAEAGFHAMNLRANLSAAGVGRYFRAMRMRHRVERADAVAAIARFFIQAASDEQIFSTLSGGNQQKAVLARWLRDQPKLLLLDEPTQGVDVRARAQIHEAVRIAARNETATLVTGSDFQELAGLCDRVLVMVQGRLAGEMRSPAIDAHRLTELAHFAPEAPS
jgi:ribose transport system ATP-binding protein